MVVDVFDRVVAVPVAVPPSEPVVVGVIVLSIVVAVLVFMLERHVAMRVCMAGSERQGDPGGGDRHRNQLAQHDWFVQPRPRAGSHLPAPSPLWVFRAPENARVSDVLRR